MGSKAVTYLACTILGGMLCYLNIVVGQDVLFDDIGISREAMDPSWMAHFCDTLDSHGVTIHLTSVESLTNLMDMDMLWIAWHPPWLFFSQETKDSIIKFARSGGKLVIWTAGDQNHRAYNDLFDEPTWQPTLQIGDTLVDYYSDTLHLIEFSPFTDNVGFLGLAEPPEILYGEHTYVFGFSGPNYYYPNVAISYPFLHESNCSSYIILVTGTAMWGADNIRYDGEYRFGSNILLTAAGVPGYELPPGAIPGGGFAPGCGGEQEDTVSECFAHPSPFTPNSDGVNDYAKFEYPGMHRNEGVAFIYTLENEFVRKLQNGEVFDSPKGTIYWDGKDAYGRLMQNGVYLYIVQDDGETKCRGTVYLAR